MILLRNYDIDISKLALGQHTFLFQIEDEFFELFDYSLIKEGSLSVKVDLEKSTSFVSLAFEISGFVVLICDRSLDPFNHELLVNNEIVLKYGEEAREVSDEIEIIPSNTQRVNIAKYLYEFISVSVPMKKLHPRYEDDPADSQIIFSSESGEKEKSDIDPRWSELKKLKNKK